MSSDSQKLNILVVDDEPDFREVLSLQLERKGYNVTTADNGKTALDLILNEKFDVAVCDIRMPYMDGISLFREVKQAPPPHPRFIFLTAFSNYSSDEILASGAAAVLHKPYSLSDLIENIENQRSKILLIEDNKLTSELTTKRLERRGFQIVPVLNGTDAISKVNSEQFELIILDFVLPDMNGFDVLKCIKREGKNIDTPVILLTAETNTDTIVEAFSLGARDYVVKPFDFKTLNARIMAHLNSGQQSEDLKVARETALETSKVKSLFLANMGHEIRTPLNGILGTANLLKQTNLTGEQRSYIDIMESAGGTLMMLLNDLLDISKIESGNLTLEKGSFNLRKMIRNSIELFFQNSDAKQVDMHCYVADDLPEYVNGDSARLRQIISNLASNALKFTDTSLGSVLLKVTKTEDYDSSSLLKFEMIDNGIGISSENQDKLFNSFSQADASTYRKFGGTGLGLSICKQLSSLMGGQIGVESIEGEGSTFWFTAMLPLSKPNGEQPLKISKELVGKSLAFISSNSISRTANKQLFKTMGINTVETYRNPFELVKENKWHNFDFIFAEIESLQDLSTVNKIASLTELANKKWIVSSFSGVDFDLDNLKGKLNITKKILRPHRYDLTMEEFLDIENFRPSKTNVTRIEESVDHHHENNTSNKDKKVASITQKGPESSVHILVVDDEKTNQMVFEKMLEKGGFKSTSVGTPQDALIQINSGKFHLVLMDFQLPGMSGSDITRIVRKNNNPKISTLPIMAITASRKPEDIQDCIASGMNGIIEKPTTIDKLKAEIEKALVKKSEDEVVLKKSNETT